MRFATAISAMLTIAPSIISAAKTTGNLGFALGAKMPDGTCKVQSDYETDFDAIQKDTGSNVVRIYAADQCNTAKEILPAAKSKNFKVVLGIWADTDESYKADKSAVIKHGSKFKDQVYAVTVGSESLYRGNFTGDELAAKISDMRSSAPDFRYGTADSWNKFQDGTADPVIAVSDILLCNAFSYWQGQKMSNATGSFFDDIMQAFGRVQSQAGKKAPELWVGETGWPTAGSSYQDAVPGLGNAKKYFNEAICGMVKWGFNVFMFEAFDEPWKPVSIGEDGKAADETHWGAMKANREEKYSLKCE